MKKIIILSVLTTLILSCGKEDGQPETPIGQGKTYGQVFYASMEAQTTPNTPGSPNTKVYADENMQVLWNENDRISVFNKTTYNYQYQFTGEDGDNYGSFEEIPVTGLISGNNLANIYAVYPYAKSNKVNNAGTAITMTLPAEQTYKEHSFGIGANSMIAVTDNNFLAFKNVGGYLSLRLYGNNVSIASISIKGNNNEKIAGKASIAVSTSTVPVTTMDNSATDEITLVCDPPVQLGTTAENYTDFWFVIPPVTFSNGFTITVTDALGGTFVKSTTKSFTVTRNQMDWMNPLQVEINSDENTFVQFEDANFKAYCVENFDTNSDGEISIAEAKVVTSISLYGGNISSLKGIEYFPNLTSLRCNNNQLTSLDLSNNTALLDLVCQSNQLTSLDVSHNLSLKILQCDNNQLTSLIIGENTVLWGLTCSNNQLTSLDLEHNTALKIFICSDNQLSHLDVSNLSLTSLDVSNNPSLVSLLCYNNQINSLNIINCSALTTLKCYSNQLASLDVRGLCITELTAWPQNITLETLNIYSGQTMLYKNSSNNVINPIDYSTEIIESPIIQYEDYKNISYSSFCYMGGGAHTRPGSIDESFDAMTSKLQKAKNIDNLYKLILFDGAVSFEFKNNGDGSITVEKYSGYNDNLTIRSGRFITTGTINGHSYTFEMIIANCYIYIGEGEEHINSLEILSGNEIELEGWISKDGSYLFNAYNTYQRFLVE